MGLIKAAIGAIGSTFGDQWQDLIQCEDMDENILMVKKTTKSGQISKGSRIIVAPGQVAVIYDSGSIVDATAEEGTYTFDQSTSPSFFGGQFGAVFKEMWERFKYNGTPNKEQSVFYFNVKEIIDNKFGTGIPIPFQDWSHAIPNQMTGSIMPLAVKVRCYGKYTFKIFDPAVFMRNHAGTDDVVTKEKIVSQMNTEVMSAFQNILNTLGNNKHKVPVLELPSNTDEIKQLMDENVFDAPIRNRGIKLVGFAIESVSLDDDSNRKIEEYEHNSNSMMQQGRILDVMDNAASNANGAANGFMGIGMMNMGSFGMANGVMQNSFGQQSQPQQQYDPYASKQTKAAPTQAPVGPICTNCGAHVTGKFCSECGTPVATGPKKCTNCGTEVTGKFCTECGTPVNQ